MKRFGLLVAALALGLAMVVGPSLTPRTSDVAVAQEMKKKTAKPDRAARRAAARSKRAATRAKRANCRRQAAAQKMGFVKRQRFIRSCMRAA